MPARFFRKNWLPCCCQSVELPRIRLIRRIDSVSCLEHVETMNLRVLCLIGLGLAAQVLPVFASQQYHVYFGCYTNEKSGSKGIHLSRFDPATGTLSEATLAVETGSPSFLAVHPDKKTIYAVGEMGGSGKKGGGVSAFKISQPDGKLSLINQVDSVGGGPCHISVDRTGKMAMIANYGGGSVASYQILPNGGISDAKSFVQHTGSSVNPQRQKEPHAHSFNPSPDNKFGFVCDLGIDKVLIYKLAPEAGSIEAHAEAVSAPGSGPRHLAVHPNGKFVFVNNELLMSVTSFAYDSQKGRLTEVATVSTLPEADRGKPGFSTAETVVHPSGKYVYVSNRTHDTIAVFSCDPETGKLALLQNAPAEGKIPRNFALDPTGRWMIVAHQNSNTAAVLSVDADSGKLTFTDKKINVGGAVCVRFVPVE
jgi:6-phosphogluconolactonase